MTGEFRGIETSAMAQIREKGNEMWYSDIEPETENLKALIEMAAGGEEIEGIVFGRMQVDSDCGSEHIPLYSECPKGVVMSWVEGAIFADYDFEASYGGKNPQPVTAWTSSKVILTAEYDGFPRVFSAPRHPINHMPKMV